MNHKPQLEPYNSLLFYRANLKWMGVIIKHRHELINVSQSFNYLTIGACGADTSTLFICAFSGSAMSAL
jgi:hypothetical protein